MKEELNLFLFIDGNQWCATMQDFQCLAENPAGFGFTKGEAIMALITELGL